MTRTWCLVVAAMVALSFMLPGASAIAQEDADEFIEGIEAYQRGEYDRAIDYLTQVVEAHPDWQTAWYYLGVSQFEFVHGSLAGPHVQGARDFSEAREALGKAMELAPSRPGISLCLGRIAEAEGDLQEAERAYRQELSLKRLVDRGPAQVGLARVCYKAARYQDAMPVLKRVLMEEPLYVEATYLLARSLIATGEYEEAVKLLKQGITTLEEWRDKIFHLLRLEYDVAFPEDPYRASTIVENWDELRKEIWALRNGKARPEKDTLEQIIQTYARAQEFALDLHMWPDMYKALGDAHEGMEDWSAMRNAYRRAMKPREGEGTEDDVDAWGRIARGYFLHGKHLFEEQGLLLSAINQFYAAEGDKLPPPVSMRGTQQGRGGLQTQRGGVQQTQAQLDQLDPEKQLDGYARALFVLGIPKDAKIDDLQPPPEPDPMTAKIFDGLGEVYLYEANTYATDKARGIESHTHEEAIEEFDKALMFCPTYVPAMLHKADAWLSLGEQAPEQATKLEAFATARDLLEQDALALEPENAELWAHLSRSYLGLDELDKADDAAKKALLLDKKSLVALNVTGLVKYFRNKCVDASATFFEAIDTAPRDFQSYVNLGNALYGLQSWGRAEREYMRALELLPKSSIANTTSQRPYVLFLIARTRQERKMYEKTVEILNEALKLRTDFYEAQRLLAAAYSGMEDWRAAEEALKGALKNAPKDIPSKIADTHAHLAQVYEVQGRLHEAMAHYRIAVATYPNNMEAKYGLERLSAQEKRFTDAVRQS